MNPAKLFNPINTIIAIFIAVACVIILINGSKNNKLKESAYEEVSQWLEGSRTKSEAESNLAKAYLRLDESQDTETTNDDEIAQSQIDHLRKLVTHLSKSERGENTISEDSQIQDSQFAVANILSENADKMPQMNKNIKYAILTIIGFCGLFTLLSCLRFALK